jgi:heme oxygenase
MQRLRAETSELHSHAESRPVQKDIAKGAVERATFIAYLGQLHVVHRALEDALRGARPAHPAIDPLATPERMRVPDLDRDLAFYGVDPANLSGGKAAADFVSAIEEAADSDPVALLGALYVLEGSTNGGRYLARSLSRSWNLDGAGVAYFDPYGERQQEIWAEFKREMDGSVFDADQEEAIVEMARLTFQAIAEFSDEVARGA